MIRRIGVDSRERTTVLRAITDSGAGIPQGVKRT